MELHVIKSGSSGNGYLFVADSGEVLALEAGCKFKEVQQILNYKVDGLVGVCVSHSHR